MRRIRKMAEKVKVPFTERKFYAGWFTPAEYEKIEDIRWKKRLTKSNFLREVVAFYLDSMKKPTSKKSP